MFGKLREKLKSWVSKVSEIKEESPKKTEKAEEISKKEKKSKGKEKIRPIEEHVYLEPEKKTFDEAERKVGDIIFQKNHFQVFRV